MKDLKKFKPLIAFIDNKKRFIILCIILFLCGLGDLFYGYLNGAALEAVTDKRLVASIIMLGLYFFIEIVLDGFVYIIANSELEKLESKLTRRIELETYNKALLLPAYAYEKLSSGEVVNRITNDSATLSFMFGRFLRIIVSFIVTFILFFYIIYNSVIVAIEILVIVTILYLLLKKYNPMLESAHKERKKQNDKYTSLSNESIRGIREIKTLGIEKNLIKDALDVLKELINKSFHEVDVRKSFLIRTKMLRTILEVGVFVTCAFLLYYGKVSLTFFVAMTYYVYRYTWLIEEINDFSVEYQKVKVAIERICEILNNKLFQDDSFGTTELKDIKGVIEFKNVTFGYPEEKKMLKNFNLKIEPNKKIAIVGRSGQGKSTLFNLLTRLFDPIKGEILLDGVNINELSEKSLRENISVIRQEPFIFNRSIKDNFKIVNPNITLKEIKKYCSLAYIDNYIEKLPKKYNTILGEGGVNLSGGQKQRLSIARTLSKKSKVVLFDEATSALDNTSQEYIKRAINEMCKDHTLIIVAHRLSTIVDADIIHVVDSGKVVASGTHSELLKTSEIYKDLYFNDNI